MKDENKIYINISDGLSVIDIGPWLKWTLDLSVLSSVTFDVRETKRER